MIDYKTLKIVEKQEKLFDRRFAGVNYWQMVRLNLVNDVEVRSKNLGKRKRNIFHNNLLYCLKNYFSDKIILRKQKPCDILYFDQCSYSAVDNKVKDTYFDFFDFEKTYKVFRCYYLRKKGLRPGVGVSEPLAKYYILRLLSKIIFRLRKCEKEEKYVEGLDRKLKEYGNKICILKEVEKATVLFWAYKPFYERLIDRCKPKAVFVVCHYDETLFPLYYVCRDKGIPVIELQHGLASGVNAYSYEDLSSSGKMLPSYIFTYGDVWNDYITMPCTTSVIPVGNAFLEDRKEYFSNGVMDYKKIVLYSFPDERDRLVDLAIFIADNLLDYQVLIKLHPREIQYFEDVEKKIISHSNLKLVDKESELYVLLSTAGHHIAISSTVLYEAAIFNSHRYVYSMPFYIDRMQPLIDAGLSEVFYERDEVLKLICASNDSTCALDDNNPMWKKGAKTNANCALEQIISH